MDFIVMILYIMFLFLLVYSVDELTNDRNIVDTEQSSNCITNLSSKVNYGESKDHIFLDIDVDVQEYVLTNKTTGQKLQDQQKKTNINCGCSLSKFFKCIGININYKGVKTKKNIIDTRSKETSDDYKESNFSTE